MTIKNPLVYLAGSIAPHDWRHEAGLSGGDLRNRFENGDGLAELLRDGFPVVQASFSGKSYRYTGPWFVGCDHSCGHGPTSHGAALVYSECIAASGLGKPHDWSEGTMRRAVSKLCLEAIERSQIVIAWLENDAYGTVAEIGYAKALNKLVIAGGPGVETSVETGTELWFAASICQQVYNIKECATPLLLLERVLNAISPQPSQCESPMEERMLSSFRDAGFTGKHDLRRGDLTLRCQVEESPYRLDFAVLNERTGAKFAIEVDGHDFHDRTKEQASRDRARDRFLQAGGWKVFRFTGSDVYRDAGSCVGEVISAAEGRA